MYKHSKIQMTIKEEDFCSPADIKLPLKNTNVLFLRRTKHVTSVFNYFSFEFSNQNGFVSLNVEHIVLNGPQISERQESRQFWPVPTINAHFCS